MEHGEPASKGARKRLQILSAARSQLIDRGHDAFSMREVASMLDMKLGHVQYYFSTKSDLLEALVREEFTSNLQEIQKITDGSASARQTLDVVVRKLLAIWMSEGAKIYIVMPFLALHDVKFRDLSEEIYSKFFAAIDKILKNTNSDDPPHQRAAKVRMITAVMDGALLQSNPDPKFQDEIIATVQHIATQNYR